MFLRTASTLEMVKVFYLVIIRLGCLLQIIVLAIYRKDINRVLVDLQIAVNLSILQISKNTLSVRNL